MKKNLLYLFVIVALVAPAVLADSKILLTAVPQYHNYLYLSAAGSSVDVAFTIPQPCDMGKPCIFNSSGLSGSVVAHGIARYDDPTSPPSGFLPSLFFFVDAPAGLDAVVNYRFVGPPSFDFNLGPLQNLEPVGKSQLIAPIVSDGGIETYVELLVSEPTNAVLHIVDGAGHDTARLVSLKAKPDGDVNWVGPYPNHIPLSIGTLKAGSIWVEIVTPICSPSCQPPVWARGFVMVSNSTGGNASAHVLVPDTP